VGERVHEVLVAGADRPVGLRDLRDQVTDLDRDPRPELAVLPEVDDHRARRRGPGELPGDRHRAQRVVAEREVAADDGDRCLRGLRARRERPRRRRESQRGDDPRPLLERAAPADRVASEEARQPVVLLGDGHLLGEVGRHADVGGLAPRSARHGRQRHPAVIVSRPPVVEHGMNTRLGAPGRGPAS
jgi:hypothetical protein